MKCHPKHPRRIGPHMRGILDFLARIGAKVLDIVVHRHVRLFYQIAGRSFSLSIPGSPRCCEECEVRVRQAIRRQLRSAGLEAVAS